MIRTCEHVRMRRSPSRLKSNIIRLYQQGVEPKTFSHEKIILISNIHVHMYYVNNIFVR